MADYLGVRPEDLTKGATSLRLNSLLPVGGLTSGLVGAKPRIPTGQMPVPSGATAPALGPGAPATGMPANPFLPPGSGPTAPTGTPTGPAPGLPSGFNIFGMGKTAGQPGGTPTTLGPVPPTPAPQLPTPQAPAPAAPTLAKAPMPVMGESFTPAPTPTPMVKAPAPTPQTETPMVKAPAPMPLMQSTEAPTPDPFGAKTLNTKTGEATMGGKPMPVPNQDVVTPQPGGAKTINTKTGEAFVDGKKVGETTPAPAAPDPLAEFETFARNYMTGTFDDVFRVTANRAIDRLGMMNQAERDAMQMRINQDPSLRGQGAGYAMLQVMARNQNFTVGELMGQLAEDSRQRIIDMQKWGFDAGLRVNEVRRARAKENFSTLLATGNWDGAAAALQGIIDRDLPGSGIKVNPGTFSSRDALTRSDFDSNLDTIRTLALTDKPAATAQVAALMAKSPERFPPGMTPDQYVKTLEEDAKRDAYSQSQFASQMQLIKDIATVNPQAAAGMLKTIMANPAYKGWFPDGSTAEQLIASFSGSNTAGNITQANTIQTEINKIASAGQSFNEAAGIYDDLFRLMGRDAVKEGRGLTLDRINTIRTADGLGAFSKDAQGNLVDENGIPLTDEDFAELGYRADYNDKVTKAKEEPWVKARELIMKSPSAQKFLDESLFPGSKDALDSYLESYFLNPGNFVVDQATGTLVPDTSKLQLPWKSPEYYHVYFTWPRAAFDEKGAIKTDAAGKPIFDMGGDVYGETLGGQKVVATPEDTELDAAWVKYQRTGGKLTAPQWYFATAGGARPPNEAAIPKEAGGGGENFLNVGTPGTGSTFVPSTPGTKGGLDAAVAKLTETIGQMPATVKQDQIVTYLNAVTGSSAQGSNDLATALAFIAKSENLPGYAANKTSQAGKDYAAFAMMLKGGVPKASAFEILALAIGADRFKASYKALTGKEWV